MLAWLGGQLAALTKGRRHIQEQHPGSRCHRFVGAVAHDSATGRCNYQLLQLRAEWDGLFPEKFFPRFATRSGFS